MGRKSQSARTDLIKVKLDPKNDMTGREFGEWKVIEYAGSKHGLWFKCLCSCGFVGIVKGLELRRRSMSCGHNGSTYKHGFSRRRKKERKTELKPRQTKHGYGRRNGKTPEYLAWVHIHTRCNNKNCKAYPDYGGRGITVCKRWDDFVSFLADMGAKPSAQHSIDRINNDGNYEPVNCRWATRAEQRRNGSRIIWFTHNQKTMCLKDWCIELGLDYPKVYQRVHRGKWPIEQAIFGKEGETNS